MMIKLAGLAALPLLALGALVGPVVAFVDVREGGEGGMHLIVPVPLLLARGALHVVPDETRIELPREELSRLEPALSELLEKLEKIPDAELIRVREARESVSVRKAGHELRVEVRTPGEEVRVRVPLRLVREALRRSEADELRPADLASLLRRLPRGEVLSVRDGEERVRIWVF
jgi:hypothetical protein